MITNIGRRMLEARILDEILDTEARVCLNGGMSNVTVITTLQAAMHGTDDQTLIEALQALEVAATGEQRLVQAALISELERRNPRVKPAVERWVDDDDDHRTYVQVLTQALAAKQTPITWTRSQSTWPTTHDWFGTINGRRVVRVWEGASGFRAKDEADRLIAIQEPTWEAVVAKVEQHFHRMGVNV